MRNRIIECKLIPTTELHPCPINWRTHPEKQRAAFRDIMAEIGFAGMIMVRPKDLNEYRECFARDEPYTLDYEILDGHLRVEELGDVEVWCAVTNLNDEEVRKFIATFDPVSAMAGRNQEILDEILATTKFENAGAQALLESMAVEKIPEITDVNPDDLIDSPSVVQRGDVWQLGRHRLLCGSATCPDDIQRLMQDELIDLYLTDPPYNVEYVGKTADALTIVNDSFESAEEFQGFLRLAFGLAATHMRPGSAYYIWHADSEGLNFRSAAEAIGEVRQCLIWVKQTMVMGRQDYHWKHEPCLYGWKKGGSHLWRADRKQTTVLEFDRPYQSTMHPTMKPIELFSYLIRNSCPDDGLVFDSFLGSGTTILAAEQLGRRAYGTELDPKYCDVIIKRWEELTGEEAVRCPEEESHKPVQ